METAEGRGWDQHLSFGQTHRTRLVFLGIIHQRMSSNELWGKERRVTQGVQTVRVSALREAPVMGKRASEWTRRLWGWGLVIESGCDRADFVSLVTEKKEKSFVLFMSTAVENGCLGGRESCFKEFLYLKRS